MLFPIMKKIEKPIILPKNTQTVCDPFQSNDNMECQAGGRSASSLLSKVVVAIVVVVLVVVDTVVVVVGGSVGGAVNR